MYMSECGFCQLKTTVQLSQVSKLGNYLKAGLGNNFMVSLGKSSIIFRHIVIRLV